MKFFKLNLDILFNEIFNDEDDLTALTYLIGNYLGVSYEDIKGKFKLLSRNLRLSNINYAKLEVDVLVRLDSGDFLEIEMNNQMNKYRLDRNIVYAFNIVSSHFPKNARRKEVKIPMLEQINFCSEMVNVIKLEDESINDACLKDKRNIELSKIVRFKFIDMNKSVSSHGKSLNKEESRMYHWSKLFMAGSLEEVEKELKIIMKEEDAMRVFDKIKRLLGNEEISALCNKEFNDMMERKSIREDALDEGRIEGEASGLARGRTQGERIGVEKKALEIARKLLKNEYGINEVSEITGVPKEKVKRIKMNLL